MKIFNLKGDLVNQIGETIQLDCKTIREFFTALFVIYPKFQRYYFDKLISGTEYVLIDSNGDVFETFCYDLILEDKEYTVSPMFKGSAGGPIMGFVMNAGMSYGMSKLADKMNPIDETGEEYEIIETNSYMYSKNENAVAQGTPIPIVYGQLRVGSLVVNSNIQNYDFDYENAEIYNSEAVLEVPAELSDFDFSFGGQSFGSDYNLRSSYNEQGTEDSFGRYLSHNQDNTKLSPPAYNGDGSKAYSADQNNESYAAGYSDDPEAGGYAKFLGPGSNMADTSSAGHKGSNSVKPALYPRNGDKDYSFRPQSSSAFCYTITPIGGVGGGASSPSQLKVGSRGNYQKLESLGVYRTVDVLSEGPIAGLALPLLDAPTYDETTQAFGNDNGQVSVALNAGRTTFAGSNSVARVGSIEFSNSVNHLIGSNTNNASVPIVRAGSSYPVNLNNRRIAANDENAVIEITVRKPVNNNDADFSDVGFGSESVYGFDDGVNGKGYVTFNKLFKLTEYLAANRNNYVGLMTFNNFVPSFIGTPLVPEGIRIPEDWATLTNNNTTRLNLNNISEDDRTISMGDGFNDLANFNLNNFIGMAPDSYPVNLDVRVEKLQSYERSSQAYCFDFGFLVGSGDPRNRINGNDDLLIGSNNTGVLLGNTPQFLNFNWGQFARLHYDTRGSGISTAIVDSTVRTIWIESRLTGETRCIQSCRFWGCCGWANQWEMRWVTFSLRSYMQQDRININSATHWDNEWNAVNYGTDSTGRTFGSNSIRRYRLTLKAANMTDNWDPFRDSAAWLGHLLRQGDFSNHVYNVFSNAHNIQRATYPTWRDIDGRTHTPVNLRIVPGAGLNMGNEASGYVVNGRIPTYTYNATNPGAGFTNVAIPVPGVIPGQSSIPGDESNDPKGFYIPDLWYRCEVIVLRKSRSSGTSGRYTYEWKNTDIDVIAQIRENGTVRRLHVVGCSDNPVYEPVQGRWTPFSFTHASRPSPFDTRTENAGETETWFQDMGIVVKIDSSHDFQSCSLRAASGILRPPSGNLNIDQEKVKLYTNYSTYISSQLMADPNIIIGQVARGIPPDTVRNLNSGRTVVLDDLFISNRSVMREDLAIGGRFPTVRFNSEYLLFGNARYNMVTSVLDEKTGTNLTHVYTGRVTGLTVQDGGAGLLGNDGALLNGPYLIFNLYNKMWGVKELIVNRTIRESNAGYRPNSTFYLYGSLTNSNFGWTTPEGQNLWRRYQFKAKLETDENGRIRNRIQVLDPGYSSTEPTSMTLALNVEEYQGFRGMRWQDPNNPILHMGPNNTTLRPVPILPKDNDSDPDVELNNFFRNSTLDRVAADGLPNGSYMANADCFLINPWSSLLKQMFIYMIQPDAVRVPGFEGQIAFITAFQVGLGFTPAYSDSQSLSSTTEPLYFNISTNNKGEITALSIDQSSSTGGYTAADGRITVRIGPPPSTTTATTEVPATQDRYAWARSILLNNTPIRDKHKRFNFANFHFDFLGGYYKNGNTRIYSSFNGAALNPEDLNQDYSRRLMYDEFKIPGQTYTINYKLWAPRNNGEKDYYYTHTVKNPSVSNVSLTFQVNQLHYIYEGDECMVFLNLKPIIGAIIGWLLFKQLAAKVIEMIVPDFGVDSTTSGGFVGPCGGPVGTQGAGPGLTNNALSGAVGAGLQEAIIQIASAAAALFGALLGFALGSKFPCNGSGGFLCIKIGSVIKNSGEIWPATLRIGVLHGIEGEDLQEEDITIQGCATSAFQKEIFLSRLPLTSKITGTNIYKNRIIKVYRKTREFDPVTGGIMEARYKIDAELFSVNEFVGGFFSYPNTAMIGTRTNSKDMPDIPQREYIIKGKLIKIPNGYGPQTGTYGGSDSRAESFFSSELQWSSNPAWVIYDLLTNPIYGMGKYGITEDEVDKWSFFKFAQRADEAVDVIIDGVRTKERRYMCNLYVSQQKPAYDYIKELLLLYGTSLHFSGGKIYISIDAPSESVMLFNNSNVSEEGFAYSTTPKNQRITACTVDFLDERDQYMMKSEYFEDPALIEEFGYKHQKIAGVAITRRGEANRLTLEKVYAKQLETEIISFKTSLQGSYLRIGDVVEVVDNNKFSSHAGGRITKINANDRKIIDLDIPNAALPSTVTTILIQDIFASTESDNEDEEERPAQYTEYTITKLTGFQIRLNSALPSHVQTGFSWIVKTGSDAHGNIKSKPYRIKSIKEIDNLQFEIQGLEYIADKYDFVDGTVDEDTEVEYDAHDIIIPDQSSFPEDT